MIVTSYCWLNQVVYFLYNDFGLTIFDSFIILKDWIDHKLKWDPSLYNNIKSVHIPADKLWKPDIILCNLILTVLI